jgi:hypothetical protein
VVLEDIPFADKSIRKNREKRAEELRQEKIKARDEGKTVGYVPKHAQQWTKTKDKETLRKKRRDERAARKEYKKQQKLDGQVDVHEVEAQ